MEVNDDRPDPDQLLAAVKAAERKTQRGRLKIFLGMSAGVGKTYAMLQAAQRLKSDGHRVTIGYVETHGRVETQALTVGLPLVPRRTLAYKNASLEEMDLDAILKERPEYVLIDELAHTNAPGSRHQKRFHDVLEVIDAGINVLTTLNVQHVESRSDVVRKITNVEIRETVPDSILDLADEIEVIDIAPEALLKRLADGKVYLGDRAERAAQNFFKPANLTALREMALRLTAEKVDHDLSQFMREKQIAGPWKTSDRLLVAIGASPTSGQLIRSTRRIAYNLEASWIAVYVETPRDLTPEDHKTLSQNLALAKELGAEIVTTSDVDVVRAILRVARQRNVTQIVVGKPVEGYFRTVFGDPSPVQRLIRQSGDIDVFVVEGGKGKRLRPIQLIKQSLYSDPKQYGIALCVVFGAVLLNYLIAPAVGYWALGLVQLAAIVIQSLFTGRGPILISAAMSALLWNFLFIPPRYTMHIDKPEDILLVSLYFIVALVTGTLAARIRARERAFQTREQRAVALFEFGRDLAQATSVDSVATKIVENIKRAFRCEVALYIRLKDGSLGRSPHPQSSWQLGEKDFSVAFWAYNNRQLAGFSTSTLSDSEALYIPLLVPNATAGVLCYRPADLSHPISVDEKSLLEALSNQAAISLERELLVEVAAHALVVEESERMHKLLLNSISHELRTPIAAIKGAVESLSDRRINHGEGIRDRLIGEVGLANDRLDRLVENLLDISRLESGHLKPRMEWCDLSDLINVVVSPLKADHPDHTIESHLQESMPLVFIDFVLLEQALKNLVSNALVHTPAGTPVWVKAGFQKKNFWISVEDRGPGLKPELIPKLFDKFYRAPDSKPGGTGLGLAIARGFVEAQGGKLSAANLAQGGALFSIELPLKDPPTLNAPGEMR